MSESEPAEEHIFGVSEADLAPGLSGRRSEAGINVAGAHYDYDIEARDLEDGSRVARFLLDGYERIKELPGFFRAKVLLRSGEHDDVILPDGRIEGFATDDDTETFLELVERQDLSDEESAELSRLSKMMHSKALGAAVGGIAVAFIVCGVKHRPFGKNK